jgi:molybdenum cofactor cytidylyltransferase
VTVAAILLAAGASSRMGEPKALVPWGGRTLIEWELEQLRASCVEEIVVVVGSQAEAIRRTLDAAGDPARRALVFNQRWPQGRATSLAAGASAVLAQSRTRSRVRPEAVVIQNVDQPALPRVIDRLVALLRERGVDAVQPAYRDAFDGREHGGHPVVVAGGLLEELSAATEATEGLRAILMRHPPLRVPMPDEPCVALDLDTPEALAEGRRVLGF